MAQLATSNDPGLSLNGSDAALPLMVSPALAGEAIGSRQIPLVKLAADHLSEHGAILFRDFSVEGVEAFRAFARGFGHELLSYDFGSTPRTRISSGVYTSTEYPAHQTIPLHNEQSYSLQWPMKIWFYCATPAARGGATPIADSRRIYSMVPEPIRQRWAARKLMYVRNYGNGLDLAWEDVFGTSDRHVVDKYCREHGIVCEWKSDGELRTRQVVQAVAQHPGTREWVWFNQAHLFHVSGLPSETREALLEIVDVEDLPRNVYYGDGAPLEESALDEIRGVLDSNRVAFEWQRGDILLLDNMLVAHARAPFEGQRRVIVAMAQSHAEA